MVMWTEARAETLGMKREGDDERDGFSAGAFVGLAACVRLALRGVERKAVHASLSAKQL